MGNFSISLRHKDTQQIIDSDRAFWPVQSFAFDKRAKRILVVHVPRPGEYIVEFRNPQSLKVKRSNLYFIAYLKEKGIEILGAITTYHNCECVAKCRAMDCPDMYLIHFKIFPEDWIKLKDFFPEIETIIH